MDQINLILSLKLIHWIQNVPVKRSGKAPLTKLERPESASLVGSHLYETFLTMKKYLQHVEFIIITIISE